MAELLKAHIPVEYSTVEEYVAKRKVRSRYTWGTDVKIFAFGDLTNICVRVYTEIGSDPQLFFPDARTDLQNMNIYYVINLHNTPNVHYDVNI